MLAADLDHRPSLEEAKAMLQQKSYLLVLFEHETEDTEAVHFVSQFLHAGLSLPVVLSNRSFRRSCWQRAGRQS